MLPPNPSDSKPASPFNTIQVQALSTLSNAITHTTRATAVELYKALGNASDWLRTDYSIAINLLEANDEWFAARAIAAVKEASNASSTADSKPAGGAASVSLKSASLSALSLVSKDEFEDWLTANVAVKYLEAELGYELNEVALILSKLQQTVYSTKDCPLSPNILFRSIKSSIDTLEIPTAPQAIIYKLYSRQLEQPLKDLYNSIIQFAQNETINYKPKPVSSSAVASKNDFLEQTDTSSADLRGDQFFDDQDSSQPQHANQHQDTASTQDSLDSDQAAHHAPNVRNQQGAGHQTSRSQSTSGRNTGHTSTAYQKPQVNMLGQVGDSISKQAAERQQAIREQSVQTLSALTRLNTQVGRGGTQRAANQATETYQSDYLLSAISQIQQAHIQTENQGELKLRTWLESGLNERPDVKCTIDTKESELIDVTDRFFEVIVEKVGVSGLLKKWLEKLKVTILKVVLRDKSFFSDVTHPARQMLNKLAKLASNDRVDHKRLEKVLDRIIDRVVVEYDTDEKAIERILVELDQLLERQAQAQRRNSERIARAYEGKQKVADARFKVVQDLDQLLSNQSVPVVLLELLDKAGWREHLALVSVRDGHDSAQYEEVYKVIELLLNWFGDHTDEAERWALELEMELEAPSLISLIRKELSVSGLIGYESIIKHLEDCLFEDAEVLMVKVEQYDWPYDKSEKEIESLRPDQEQDGQSGYWHKRILSMKVGDWLEVKDDKGRPRCMRLAWSGRSSLRFVFVDSQGMKDEDISLKEMVQLFKDNRASFVDHEDVPLVDQGLHQMVQTVYEELASQSSCDVLTGLLNRQAFERGLQQSISGALSQQEPVALLYIDLDKFSLTNASYGHHAGDALLKHVAKLIREQGTEEAFCGRLGGNEFGMILNQCSPEKALDIARSICKSVEQGTYSWEQHKISSSVSIGLANFDSETDSSDSLMRKAGLACETAKNNGRNRVVVYEEKDDDLKKRQAMLQWVNYLDGDLDELLTLRCQEIRPIDLTGQQKPHYEVLLGVKQNGQILPPGLLIEAAEHFNRMAKVDRWVIHNVLQWIEANQAIAVKANGFSINLSGNSLNDDHFLEFLLGQFEVSSVAPEMICFEITETAAITNLSDATEFIRVLKQTGCKFALDDFGAGLSSYAYIQKLPVDYIKIDGIFIRNIASNTHDQALVKSINELAHFMGMKTVAEFVESHEILNVLREIGVDHSQGFGIKKPTLLDELGSYIH